MTIQTITLNLPETIYQQAKQVAETSKRSVEDVLIELLQIQFQPTEHPYVVQREGFRGGRPILRGTSFPAWRIVAMWKGGDTMEEIAQAYPHVELAAIYDAMSYYFDHRAEIDEQIAENRIERVLKKHSATMDQNGIISFTDSK